jgi:hypothetical protein
MTPRLARPADDARQHARAAILISVLNANRLSGERAQLGKRRARWSLLAHTKIGAPKGSPYSAGRHDGRFRNLS